MIVAANIMSLATKELHVCHIYSTCFDSENMQFVAITRFEMVTNKVIIPKIIKRGRTKDGHLHKYFMAHFKVFH